MVIPIYYTIPIVLLVLFALHSIYRIYSIKSSLPKGNKRDVYFWMTSSMVLFVLWGLLHIYGDLYPLSQNAEIFLHYITSHLFLLGAVICIAITIPMIKNKGAKK